MASTATRYQAFVQVEGESLPRFREVTSRAWADDALWEMAQDATPVHAWIQVMDGDDDEPGLIELY